MANLQGFNANDVEPTASFDPLPAGKYLAAIIAQFTGVGHGIHELPEWPSGYKEGEAHLGIPVSHGCVRLGVGPAETMYHWAPIGTIVFIHP